VPAGGGAQATLLGFSGGRGFAVSMPGCRASVLLPGLGAAGPAVPPAWSGSGPGGAPAARCAGPLGGDAGHGWLEVGGQVPSLARGVRNSIPGARALATDHHLRSRTIRGERDGRGALSRRYGGPRKRRSQVGRWSVVLAPVGDQYGHRRKHRGDDRHGAVVDQNRTTFQASTISARQVPMSAKYQRRRRRRRALCASGTPLTVTRLRSRLITPTFPCDTSTDVGFGRQPCREKTRRKPSPVPNSVVRP
jgi:hypothetical protein